MALGLQAAASGTAALATGINTAAKGASSTALGNLTTASGDWSTAMGRNTIASGDHSTAMGYYTTASGYMSTAMGRNTVASENGSTAMGYETAASGDASTAMGRSTRASGSASTAMGLGTVASGTYSVAMGGYTTASGEYTTAMGTNASTDGQRGSFVYGDASTPDIFTPTDGNQFAVRANGGLRFRTLYDLSTGCDLPSGSGSWSCTSSRLQKTGFESLEGEAVLARVRELPVALWSYKAEPGVRHLGTFAEDLHRAFGLGTDSTSIGTIDMDGVNLAAVKALEQRTRDLQQQLSAKDREIADLRQRLERLEAARP